MNKYIDGWKCEEAIMFALDIFSKSIQDYQNQLEDLLITNYDLNGYEIVDTARDIEVDIIFRKSAQGLNLLEALKLEVNIAIQHYRHTERCNNTQIDRIPPEESTLIELYKYEEKQNIDEIKIKKRSLAAWLYQLGEKDLSEKVDPNLDIHDEKNAPPSDASHHIEKSGLQKHFDESGSSKTSLKDLFEADEIPDLLYFAYDTFQQAWLNLPKNMKQPTKEQLTRYLREVKGVKLQSEIDAIIKVSTPSGITLGGRQKTNLTTWYPLSQRK